MPGVLFDVEGRKGRRVDCIAPRFRRTFAVFQVTAGLGVTANVPGSMRKEPSALALGGRHMPPRFKRGMIRRADRFPKLRTHDTLSAQLHGLQKLIDGIGTFHQMRFSRCDRVCLQEFGEGVSAVITASGKDGKGGLELANVFKITLRGSDLSVCDFVSNSISHLFKQNKFYLSAKIFTPRFFKFF